MERVTLIGGGLAGALLAVYLARRGFAVDVFEKRADMRKLSTSAGRSINLALSTRGIHALKEVALAEVVLRDAIPMRGRMLHSSDGNLSFAPYGKNDTEVINSISRRNLNISLMTAAERHKNVRFHFNQRCVRAEAHQNGVMLELLDEETGHSSTVESSLVIGTDGSASAVRADLFKLPRFDFLQEHLQHSYKELTIPPASNATHVMQRHALHIWPRGGFMMIALPNPDGSFTCTLFYLYEGERSFVSLKDQTDVLALFRAEFQDALALMPTLKQDFFENPIGHLATIKCFPWHHTNKLLLIGDAAHAIVPFYGQGMNCAFEDCSVLDECIGRHVVANKVDWESVFLEYEVKRKPNTDAIADLALDNFIEMRDLVARPKFLLKRKLEHLLEERYPGDFISKYAMVTFHRIPYAEAMRKGRIQDIVLDEAVAQVDSLEEINLELLWGKMCNALVNTP